VTVDPAQRLAVVDLDGTLLDTRRRQYEVYRDAVEAVVPDDGLDHPDLDTFWRHKRAGESTRHIAARRLEASDADAVARRWESWIEEREYLRLDDPFDGVEDALGTLADRVETVLLVTHRSVPENVSWQLDRLELSSLVDEYYAVPHGTESKADRLRTEGYFFDDDDTVYGDSETDLRAADELGCRGVAVATGVRSVERLRRCQPDAVYPDLPTAIDSPTTGRL
jgi:phosphoglycolate phosphatase-like HAD superfamily hydrolase